MAAFRPQLDNRHLEKPATGLKIGFCLSRGSGSVALMVSALAVVADVDNHDVFCRRERLLVHLCLTPW